MALSVTNVEQIVVSDCSSLTDWALHGVATDLILDTGEYIEGASSVSAKVSNGVGGVGLDFTVLAVPQYFMINIRYPALLDTFENGGIRIICGLDASNYNEWYVGGSDSYKGGWQLFRLYASSTIKPPTNVIGSPGVSRDFVGVVIKTTAPVAGNNLFINSIKEKPQITITGTSDSLFEDVYLISKANNYNLIDKDESGVYKITGTGIFTGSVDLSDTSKIVVHPVSKYWDGSVYQSAIDYATFRFQSGPVRFGEGIGSGVDVRGVKGCYFDFGGGSPFEGSFIDLTYYSCTIANVSGFFYSANIKYYDTDFINVDMIAGWENTFWNCSFIGTQNSGTSLLSINVGVDDIKNVAFFDISPTKTAAVSLSLASPDYTYVLDNFQFFGNTVDLYASISATPPATGTVVNGNGSNASTWTNTDPANYVVSIVPDGGALTFNVYDAAGNALTGYEWRLYEDDPTPGMLGTVELAGEETAASSQQTYEWTTGATVVLQIIDTNHEEYIETLTLASSDINRDITLIAETNL